MGRRDGGLSARRSTAAASRAGVCGGLKTATATAATIARPCSSRLLDAPTGVMPWRKGVLVTAAPDLLYAEDRDGDGKADHREALYTGFNQGNPQHRINGLRWGLDNWIYMANGDSGGEVESMKTGKVVNINNRDVRVRPDTGEIEAVAGQAQFGREQDDWGNWFGNNNSNPL